MEGKKIKISAEEEKWADVQFKELKKLHWLGNDTDIAIIKERLFEVEKVEKPEWLKEVEREIKEARKSLNYARGEDCYEKAIELLMKQVEEKV